MVYYSETSLIHLVIHQVGNKLLDEKLILSEHSIEVSDAVLKDLLMKYFFSPFEKTNEVYRLYHPTEDLNLNEVYHFASNIFKSHKSFHKNTQQIAKHLYDISNHPKIKSGELYFAYLKDMQIEGEVTDAVGIFKSETKESYLKIRQKGNEFNINYEEDAININKLDKGCLIFNTEKDEGYKIAVIDQTNRSEAAYWIDDFLKLKIRNDNYNQTQNLLSVYKTFVTKEMDNEFAISKADKIDLLNRSIKYFKEKDHFNIDEFSNEVIDNEKGIEAFKNFKTNYEDEYQVELNDSFLISNPAVKKQARLYKSVLKLDKNFHIYIHGNTELIEKGFDEKKKMNYYKVYFKEEQ